MIKEKFLEYSTRFAIRKGIKGGDRQTLSITTTTTTTYYYCCYYYYYYYYYYYWDLTELRVGGGAITWGSR